jgi:hypothetical protein
MWNYKIGTRLNKTLLKGCSEELSRQFFIFECYYDEKGIPDGHFEEVETDIIHLILLMVVIA